jgi:hypothetical protein
MLTPMVALVHQVKDITADLEMMAIVYLLAVVAVPVNQEVQTEDLMAEMGYKVL